MSDLAHARKKHVSSSTLGVAEELHEATETTLPAFQSTVADTVEKGMILTMRVRACMHVLLEQMAEVIGKEDSLHLAVIGG